MPYVGFQSSAVGSNAHTSWLLIAEIAAYIKSLLKMEKASLGVFEMNRSWSRFLRSTYRREPIVSFVVTAGVVEAAIGGLGEHWLLMMFGLGTAGAAMTLRWWQQYRSISTASDRAPIYVLPPRSSRPVLPTLRLQTPPDSKR